MRRTGVLATVSSIKTVAPFARFLCRLTLTIGLAAIGKAAIAAEPSAPPVYQVGDKASSDVVTSIPLVVFDPVRTETLRQAEGRKATPIFRHVPDAGQQAETDLRNDFARNRDLFAATLESTFNHAPPLLVGEFAQPQFRELLTAVQQRAPAFPLGTNLAELWALGDSGDVVLDKWIRELRRWTNRQVRSDSLPPGERLVPSQVRLVSVTQTNSQLTLAMADRQGRNTAKSNVVTLSRLQQEVQRPVEEIDQTALRYIAAFLRPNCYFDEELTREARARRMEPINAADRYDAGQVIVQQGETITAKTKLALDELRNRTEADRVEASAAIERSRVESEAAAARHATEMAERNNRKLLIGLYAATVVCFVAVGLWWRRRRLAPVGTAVALTEMHGEEAEWRERAIAAEARAEKATELLRANLLPHMARWMMNALVQRLLSQRTAVLTSQAEAEREVAALADRLEQLHIPLEQRLAAYEQRIAELEAQLAAKDEQNAELIKAKIETTRKKLEVERSQDPLNWN